MLSKEQRAEISRRNGAKSKGPITPEGKERSRRNALQHGHRATILKNLVPPHSAVLCSELRKEYYAVVDANTARYKPVDDAEYRLVREITDCEWKISRASQLENSFWNRAYLLQPNPGPSGLPELAELEAQMGAVESLAANPQTIRFLTAEVRRLTLQAARCRRELAALRRHFPATGPDPAGSLLDRQYYDYPGLGLVDAYQPAAPSHPDDERTWPEPAAEPIQLVEKTEQVENEDPAAGDNCKPVEPSPAAPNTPLQTAKPANPTKRQTGGLTGDHPDKPLSPPMPSRGNSPKPPEFGECPRRAHNDSGQAGG